MALYYDKWYKNNGLRYSEDLTDPKIRLAEEIEFPKSSIVHWAMIDDIALYPTSNTNIFKRAPVDNTIVRSILEYSDPSKCVGDYSVTSNTIQDLIRDIASHDDNFHYLKNNEELNKGNLALYINNYGSLNIRYRYPIKSFYRYHRYINFMRTVIDRLYDRPDRHAFLVLQFPKVMPSRLDLNKFSKKLEEVHLKKLSSYKHFNLLELWKLFNPEHRTESVFNQININRAKNIDLILMIGSRVIIMNLYKILSMVKEYNIIGDIKPYKWDLIQKSIYLMLYKLATEENIDTIKLNMKIEKPINSKNPEEYNLEKEVNNALEEDVIEVNDLDDDNTETITNKQEIAVKDQKDESVVDVEELTEIDDEGISKENKIISDTLDMSSDAGYTEEDLFNNHLHYDGVENKIDALFNNKVLNKKQADSLKNTLDEQKGKVIQYCGNLRLGEILDDNNDNYNIKPNLSTIKDTPMVLDKTVNNITTQAIAKDYINNQYKKDIIRTIFSIQNTNSIIMNHNVELKESIAGKLEEHTIELKTLNGQSSTIKIVLPVIEKDGTFEYSGSKYRCRYQISDLPIRKINAKRVALSTHYGKLFIDKSYYSSDDKGRWLSNAIANMQGNGVEGLLLGSNDNMDVKLPMLYSLLSRNIRFFRFKDYTFNLEYRKRYNIFKDINEQKAIEWDKKFKSHKVVVIGKYKNYPLVIDFQDRLFVYKDNEFIEQDTFYNILGIIESESPIEYTTIKTFNKVLPLAVPLCYYIGLSNLLSVLNIDYKVIEDNSRYTPTNNEFVIKFKDKRYVITRDYDQGDLLLAGLLKINKITKNIPSIAFEDRSMFAIVISSLELNINIFNEIKMLENMFIDPMSMTVLKQMNEPTNFKGLLLRSNELLVTDFYNNPNNIKGSLIRGYERIAGMMYKELCSAIKEHENRTHFSRSKITMNPYSVLNKIQEDSSTVAVDNLNPMASIKQSEDTTKIGQGGRSKLSMSKETRVVDPSEIGIVSEASKDSGDVGITGFLTADPKLNNTRGMIGNFNVDESGWGSIVSTSAMLSPFALHDDTKRLNFATIMNTHVVPINNTRVPYVLTGYEAIIALKADNKFAISAKEDGVVLDVKDKSITVKYKTLGEETYKFSDWTTKEESGSCYTHKLKPNFNKDDKFSKDDTLVYNTSFFEPCSFYPQRVIYKQGELVTTVLMENMETHEDSGAISGDMTKRLGVNVTKVVSTVVNMEDNIIDALTEGTEVTPNTSLFLVYNKVMGEDQLDKETLELIKSLNSVSPKAKVNGVISKIDVRYNGEYSTMSNSMKSFITKVDKNTKERTGYVGKVDDSYSVKGKSLLKGYAEIKYYIDMEDNMGIGDKAILGNQMKFTVGDVFHNEIKAEDGTPIDVIFSCRSISARIVNSPFLIGTTSMLLEKLSEKAIELYFGTKEK